MIRLVQKSCRRLIDTGLHHQPVLSLRCSLFTTSHHCMLSSCHGCCSVGGVYPDGCVEPGAGKVMPYHTAEEQCKVNNELAALKDAEGCPLLGQLQAVFTHLDPADGKQYMCIILEEATCSLLQNQCVATPDNYNCLAALQYTATHSHRNVWSCLGGHQLVVTLALTTSCNETQAATGPDNPTSAAAPSSAATGIGQKPPVRSGLSHAELGAQSPAVSPASGVASGMPFAAASANLRMPGVELASPAKFQITPAIAAVPSATAESGPTLSGPAQSASEVPLPALPPPVPALPPPAADPYAGQHAAPVVLDNGGGSLEQLHQVKRASELFLTLQNVYLARCF